MAAIAGELAATGSVPAPAAAQLVDYLAAAREALGALPSRDTIIAERFFDEAGGMQLILHAPLGGRINKAWGLALRKRFCRSFNFELQAAATDDGIVISLGPVHSFPLADVFQFLRASTAREILTQAVLAAPVFGVRWRWNTTRALAVLRRVSGKKVPPQLLRMKTDDLLGLVFPMASACLENVVGDIELPDHPLVTETMRDCLEEFLDVDGLIALLERIERGEVTLIARDTVEPSPLSHEISQRQPLRLPRRRAAGGAAHPRGEPAPAAAQRDRGRHRADHRRGRHRHRRGRGPARGAQRRRAARRADVDVGAAAGRRRRAGLGRGRPGGVAGLVRGAGGGRAGAGHGPGRRRRGRGHRRGRGRERRRGHGHGRSARCPHVVGRHRASRGGGGPRRRHRGRALRRAAGLLRPAHRRRAHRAPGLARRAHRRGAGPARGRGRGVARRPQRPRRRRRVLRPPHAGAHPPPHPRAAAARDRAGQPRHLDALLVPLAAGRAPESAHRCRRAGAGHRAAAGLRERGRRLGARDPAGAAVRLRADLARLAVPVGRGDLGAAFAANLQRRLRTPRAPGRTTAPAPARTPETAAPPPPGPRPWPCSAAPTCRGCAPRPRSPPPPTPTSATPPARCTTP